MSMQNIHDYIDDEEEERLNAIISHICGNSIEDSHDLDHNHILSDLSLVPHKKKSNSAKIK